MMDKSIKRIFVAVDISDEARRKVTNYIENLRSKFSHHRVGWEKPEKLHITLKFLGDIDELQLRKLKEIVEKIASGASTFQLQLENTGVFRSAKNPRVLWVGALWAKMISDQLAANVDFVELYRQIEIESVKNGFSRGHRNLEPHLTIARLREPQTCGELVKTHLQNEFESVGFEVSEIVIYESKLQPTGSIYSVVSRHKLKK